MEKVVGAAVELRHRYDVIARLGDVENRIGDGGLTGRVSERATAAFEGGDALLEHVGGRIHDPRVDVTQFFKGKEISGMLGVAKHEAAGLVDRNGAGAGGGIRSLPCMEGFGAEALGSRHREEDVKQEVGGMKKEVTR